MARGPRANSWVILSSPQRLHFLTRLKKSNRQNESSQVRMRRVDNLGKTRSAVRKAEGLQFEQPINFADPSKIVEIPSRRPPLRTGDCECYRDQKRRFLDNYSQLFFGIEQELTYILTRRSDDGQSPLARSLFWSNTAIPQDRYSKGKRLFRFHPQWFVLAFQSSDYHFPRLNSEEKINQ